MKCKQPYFENMLCRKKRQNDIKSKFATLQVYGY